jgi:hypothetical protein
MEQNSGRSCLLQSCPRQTPVAMSYVKSGSCQFFPALPLTRPTEFAVRVFDKASAMAERVNHQNIAYLSHVQFNV